MLATAPPYPTLDVPDVPDPDVPTSQVIAGAFGVTEDQRFVLAFAGYGRIRANAV